MLHIRNRFEIYLSFLFKLSSNGFETATWSNPNVFTALLELHAALFLVRVAIGDERRRQTMAHCSDGVKANIPCFVRLPDCRVFQVHVSKNARGQDCLLKVSSSSGEQGSARVSADSAGSPVLLLLSSLKLCNKLPEPHWHTWQLIS